MSQQVCPSPVFFLLEFFCPNTVYRDNIVQYHRNKTRRSSTIHCRDDDERIGKRFASSSRRRSAVEVIQSIRTYLNQATAITVDDDQDSNIHFDTPCGYCLFKPDRQIWQVRHRPFGTRPNDVGVLGGDCSSPTTVHATTLAHW